MDEYKILGRLRKKTNGLQLNKLLTIKKGNRNGERGKKAIRERTKMARRTRMPKNDGDKKGNRKQFVKYVPGFSNNPGRTN